MYSKEKLEFLVSNEHLLLRKKKKKGIDSMSASNQYQLLSIYPFDDFTMLNVSKLRLYQ
jgi:hypothetical protein